MSSAESDQGWYLRPNHIDSLSKKHTRYVDLELERVKSLGVVSVLNKSFLQEALPTSSEQSPSPSLTKQNTTANMEQPASCNKEISANSLRDTLVCKQSSPVSQQSAKIATDEEHRLLAAPKSQSERCVSGSSWSDVESDVDRSPLFRYPGPSLDTLTSDDYYIPRKDINTSTALQARIAELEQLCAESAAELEKFQQQANEYKQCQAHVEQATRDALVTTLEQKELESVKVRQLSDVVLKQDRLVQELETHLDHIRLENQRLKSTSLAQELKTMRDELDSLRPELLKLLEDKQGCEQTIDWLRNELEQSQENTRKTMDLSRDLQAQCVTQQTHIDHKLQLLTRLLQEKDQQIRRYRDRTDRRVSAIPEATPPVATVNHDLDRVDADSRTTLATPSRSTSFSSYSTPHVPESLVRDSCQSTSSTNLTTATNSTASMSTLASSHFNSLSKRSYVVKWSNGSIPPASPPPTIPLPPLPPSKDTPPAKRISPPSVKRSSILEFARHIEERLSLAKDFTDLHVWEPADFTLLPLIETPPPPPPIQPVASPKPKENSAFWKGVKKRLKV